MRIKDMVGSALAVVLAATAIPATAATYVGSAVVSGLNNPRGLAFGPDGALYIAEAGFLGASGPMVEIRGAQWRYGETGSITRYAGGVQQRIVAGLPSLSAIVTGETTGAQDIAFGAGGTGYVAIGLGTDPGVRAGALGSAPGALNLGSILTFTGGTPVSIADVGAFEAASNPAGGAFDSNPYHLAALPGGGVLVTDAGGNSLLTAPVGGPVALSGVFPGRDIGGGFPSDSVPTGIAIGPDGAYYIAELTGFPFTQGAAQVYRLEPGGAPTVFRTGFTNITDIAFGRDGSLYVLELDSDGLLGPAAGGALIRVAVDGTRETLFSQGLITPTGLEIGPDGAFYVANFSAAAGRGEVLRIAAVPEPAAWAMMISGVGLIGGSLRRRRGGTETRAVRAAA